MKLFHFNSVSKLFRINKLLFRPFVSFQGWPIWQCKHWLQISNILYVFYTGLILEEFLYNQISWVGVLYLLLVIKSSSFECIISTYPPTYPCRKIFLASLYVKSVSKPEHRLGGRNRYGSRYSSGRNSCTISTLLPTNLLAYF